MSSPEFALPPGDLWVFGYGSLMWRPGFEFLERHTARLYGYHRALCVWSWVHRGTPEKPGLVFGLDAGGSCVGRVFRVAAGIKYDVADYLYQREMVTAVYRSRLHRVYSAGGDPVIALTFIVDRAHAQYAGRLDAATAAAVVARSQGQSGPNPEYLLSTVAHMEELGIHEPELGRVRDHLLQRDGLDSIARPASGLT
jgi:cation transport protein ChaC